VLVGYWAFSLSFQRFFRRTRIVWDFLSECLGSRLPLGHHPAPDDVAPVLGGSTLFRCVKSGVHLSFQRCCHIGQFTSSVSLATPRSRSGQGGDASTGQDDLMTGLSGCAVHRLSFNHRHNVGSRVSASRANYNVLSHGGAEKPITEVVVTCHKTAVKVRHIFSDFYSIRSVAI